MSDFGSDGTLRRRCRLKVPGREAWFTWVGDEDPTDDDIKAMQALVDGALKMDRPASLPPDTSAPVEEPR